MNEIQEAMEKALASKDEWVESWTVVWETIDANGERVLRHEISPGLSDWSRVGMLYAALDMGPYFYESQGEVEE